jgi:GTP-binding protein HflX
MHMTYLSPYEEGAAHARLMGNANIINSVNHEKGIFYRIRIPDFIFNQLNFNKYILNPENPLYSHFTK